MSPLEALAVLAAGLSAGTISTVVGSGSLVTSPVLLGLGCSPLVADVTPTVGLVPGSLSAPTPSTTGRRVARPSRVLVPALILLAGVYGGCFGAAQGIVLLVG